MLFTVITSVTVKDNQLQWSQSAAIRIAWLQYSLHIKLYRVVQENHTELADNILLDYYVYF